MRKQFLNTACFFIITLLVPISALRADNTQIPVQGYLTDASGNVVNATTDMVFRLYTVATGGTAVWSSGTVSVAVSNGFYSTTLGSSSNAIPSLGTDLYLGITVGTDSEMLPRNEFSAVPFALSCTNCSTLVLVNTTDASNTTTGSEETVATYTIPANTLNNTGEVLHIKSFGTLDVVGAGDQSAKMYIGSDEVASLDYSSGSDATSTWTMQAEMIRTGSSTAEISVTAREHTGGAFTTYKDINVTTLTGVDYTASFDVNFSCTLQTGGACTVSNIIVRADK